MTMMDEVVSEGLDWRNGTFWRNMARNWVTYGQITHQLLRFFRPVRVPGRNAPLIRFLISALYILFAPFPGRMS